MEAGGVAMVLYVPWLFMHMHGKDDAVLSRRMESQFTKCNTSWNRSAVQGDDVAQTFPSGNST